jgi:hypothetical protein
LIKRALGKLTIERSTGEVIEEVPEEIFYAPGAKLTPEQRRLVSLGYELAEAILDSMRRRIDAAIGPGRFAVLLAPTKYEYGQYLNRARGDDPHSVANGMLASLARLKIPAVDARDVIDSTDFWQRDAHWLPSGHAKIGAALEEFISGGVDRRGQERIRGQRNLSANPSGN